MAKRGRRPTHEAMQSAHPKEKEPIYFQMTEVEVATVFKTAAGTILIVVL